MEWFGLTSYGFPDYFKDLMREDYKEPKIQPSLYEAIENMSEKGGSKQFSEMITELDCYIGHADGFAYGSYDRLIQSRKKGITKPVGPNDMYKYSGTDSMNPGWWIQDPAIIGEKWYKPCTAHSISTSPMSRYVNQVLKIDKSFKL